jgi:hypothetical protein
MLLLSAVVTNEMLSPNLQDEGGEPAGCAPTRDPRS